MMKLARLMIVPALCTIGLTAPATAASLPMVSVQTGISADATIAVPVRHLRSKARNWNPRRAHRGNRYSGYRYRRNRGVNVGQLVVGTIGALIIAQAIREGRASDNDIDACDRRYISFDHRTGTYTGYDGHQYVCPYLQ